MESGITPLSGSLPETVSTNRQLARVLEDCIETLPANFSVVFVMRAVEHLSTR